MPPFSKRQAVDLVNTTTSGPSYSFTGLTAGGEVQFYVSAINDNGRGLAVLNVAVTAPSETGGRRLPCRVLLPADRVVASARGWFMTRSAGLDHTATGQHEQTE